MAASEIYIISALISMVRGSQNSMVIKKFNCLELAQNIHASRNWCHMHVHQFLVGVASLVSEMLLLSKTSKFPFPTMDYSPWSSKNLINWNWLKKFMLVGIDVTCMYTNFGGCGLSDFGDITTLKNGQISLSDHGL